MKLSQKTSVSGAVGWPTVVLVAVIGIFTLIILNTTDVSGFFCNIFGGRRVVGPGQIGGYANGGGFRVIARPAWDQHHVVETSAVRTDTTRNFQTSVNVNAKNFSREQIKAAVDAAKAQSMGQNLSEQEIKQIICERLGAQEGPDLQIQVRRGSTGTTVERQNLGVVSRTDVATGRRIYYNPNRFNLFRPSTWFRNRDMESRGY